MLQRSSFSVVSQMDIDRFTGKEKKTTLVLLYDAQRGVHYTLMLRLSAFRGAKRMQQTAIRRHMQNDCRIVTVIISRLKSVHT